MTKQKPTDSQHDVLFGLWHGYRMYHGAFMASLKGEGRPRSARWFDASLCHLDNFIVTLRAMDVSAEWFLRMEGWA